MSVVSYKCPHCGGGLNYSPGVGFKCEYCLSVLTKEELSTLSTEAETSENEVSAQSEESIHFADANTEVGEMLEYTCPNCGASIITDATTAATSCHYCHNPIVLTDKLKGDFAPDGVIAFKIDKNKAIEMFKKHCSNRPFLPSDFYSENQIDNLYGVYYPYWLVDSKVDGRLTATGEIDNVSRRGNDRITDTSVYSIERSGIVNLDAMANIALKKGDKLILKYILPFKLDEMKPFSMQYLSGFRAEKRDMERSDLQSQIDQRKTEYTGRLLGNEINGYSRVYNAYLTADTIEEYWKYALLPVWILTYKYRGTEYIYGINGQTGKSYGSLPIDKSKLFRTSLLVGLGVAMFVMLIGGMFL